MMLRHTTTSRYSEKPFIIAAKEAHRKGIVTYQKNGTAILAIPSSKLRTRIPREHQYDVTQATIFGLNERLTQSATSPKIGDETLRDRFNREWEAYTAALENAEKTGRLDYGTYAYYKGTNDLVRYCDPFWHRVVACASSSKLITDRENRLTWHQIREVFEHTTIAVAGGSVGNNVLHSVVMDLRPAHIKIADKSLYKIENINRVRLTYADVVQNNSHRTNRTDTLLRNKAEVSAMQLYAIDPFITVHAYPEGIDYENAAHFFDGKPGEPKADIVVDEVDDPHIKILLREEARKRRVPLVMVTDVGSAVQLDVIRYDEDPMLSLTYGVEDEVLYRTVEEWEQNPGNRGAFFRFVDTLIGTNYRRDELAKIILEKSEIPTATIIPQLGSTAAMAGAVAAETIARIRLGHDYPPRVLIDKFTFEVIISH
jgi:molybdopterin/thiamine biosynthesis adenylyltransferase